MDGTVDATQRAFYAMKFEIAFLRARGKTFEELFARVMGHACSSDFEQVRPYGRLGDRKCDGYRGSDGTVFQCYAPDSTKLADLLAKIDEDFDGAKMHWGARMKRWTLVHNDDRGLPTDATMRLADLRTANPAITIDVFQYPEMREVVLGLTLAQLEDLFGSVPSQRTLESLDFAALRPVLLRIQRQEPDAEPPLTAPSPAKLQNNTLSQDVANLLRQGGAERSLREIAERYVTLRSAGIVLRHAIDRYRREKQAPLLKRAGQLFSILTGQSFSELQLELDERDNAHLAGVRRGGGNVPVSGMSTGTAGQLYLALRLAAVEDNLGHATPLPFVADDLFINFDDDRSRAGFQVLGEIAKKTQVLFFTHHQHLIDVAQEALGDRMSVIELSGPSAAYQAPFAIVAAQ